MTSLSGSTLEAPAKLRLTHLPILMADTITSMAMESWMMTGIILAPLPSQQQHPELWRLRL